MIPAVICPTGGCDGELRPHCRDQHPTCTWSKCVRCGCYGDPSRHGRWHTPTPTSTTEETP